MKENSIEEDIEEKLNKNLDFLIKNANKMEQLTAVNIVAMKQPTILLFLSILSDYKRVLKENELLRKNIEGWKKYCEEIEEERIEMSNKNCELEFEVEKLQKENEELKKYKEYYSSARQLVDNNYIHKQKVKDRIEKLKNNPLKIKQNDKYYYETDAYNKIVVQVLQELLEGRE